MTARRSAVLARLDATPRQLAMGRRCVGGSAPWIPAAALACVAVGIALASPVVVVAGPPAILAARQLRRRRHQRLERHRADRSVIDFVDRLSQHLRGGSSLAAAIELEIVEVDAPLVDLVRPVRTAISSGEGLDRALGRLEGDQPHALDLLVSSLRLLLENGGPAAVALDRIGETLRAGVAARDEAAAQSGQATASALLLAVLPFLFALLVALVEPAAAALYLTTWSGAGCIAGAAALSFASWWWIDRVVHR